MQYHSNLFRYSDRPEKTARFDDPTKIMFAAIVKGRGKAKVLSALGVPRMKEICAELDAGGDFKCDKVFGTGAVGTVRIAFWLLSLYMCSYTGTVKDMAQSVVALFGSLAKSHSCTDQVAR